MTLQRQNTTLELTLSLFTVVVVLLVLTVWVLIPETKTYLLAQERADHAVQQTKRLQAEYDKLYAKKEATEAEAAAVGEQFENIPDAAALQAWLVTGFDEAEAADGGAGTFLVKTVAASPAAFYRFVDRLDTAPWAMRVGTPLEMHVEKGRIVTAFTLRPATQAAATLPLQK